MTKQSLSMRSLGAALGSRKFFWGILALFVLEAVWIALSGRYPMAFDEDFHLGIIRLYAHHLNPFLSGQPPGADAFGAVARDPSYLYHYVMSFPYRLIGVFTHDQTLQVLWLRAVNIALFAGGLVVYRRLLLKTGASRAIVHFSLLIFVLIPVVPLLAAQINYDNLFLPLVGLVLLLVLRFRDQLVKQKRLNARLLIGLLALCMLTSLVKYAFLPIFLAIVIYLAVNIWRFRTEHYSAAEILAGLKPSLWTTGLVIAGFVAAGALFTQRYGINIVRYHTPVPDCGQVLSVKQCSAYGPWIRDYDFEINKVDEARNPAVFTGDWLYGMWLRLFFAVDGPATGFETKGPLMIPGGGAIIFSVFSFAAIACYGRRLFRIYNTPVLRLLMFITVIYVGTLWLDEFRAYLRTGQPVAINGRYLFPVLPFLILLSALAINEFCHRRANVRLWIGSAAIVCLLWGGGALTYILRSQPAWYWPNSTVRTTNRAVQKTLGPITPGYRQPRLFLR